MLRDDQDAYGREILDYLEKGTGFEVVERDDGLVNISGGPASYFLPVEKWPEAEQEAIPYVQGRVLDVGCGAGRWALYLQEHGHEVVGIDNSPLAVEVCKRRGVRDARVMSFAQVDSSLGLFDTVLMMGNNFGLFGGLRTAQRMLARLKDLTNAGARIVAASRDPYDTQSPEHLRYHERNRHRGRMAGQLRLRIRYCCYCTPWFDYLLASPDEMREMVRGTGWRLSQLVSPGGSYYVGVIEKEG